MPLDVDQQRIVQHKRGPLLVIGQPGTGKTHTLASCVRQRIREGVDGQHILVITADRSSAYTLRTRLAATLERSVQEPLIGTMHAYAYRVLCREAAAASRPAPRLLTRAEQDTVIAELLAGDLEGSGVTWPQRFHQALGTHHFASTLRTFLSQCLARGISPETLREWARVHERPEWTAVADFIVQYARVTHVQNAAEQRMGEPELLDPAELIATVTQLLKRDAQLCERERRDAQYIYVDDHTELDPAQLELLSVLRAGGLHLVAFADPEHTVFSFRGASASAAREFSHTFAHADGAPAATLELTQQHRAYKERTTDVHVFPSGTHEATYIAQYLRTQHVLHRVPFSQMAVIARTTEALAPLRRALHLAQVPTAADAPLTPLRDRANIASFLLLVRLCLRHEELSEENLTAVLLSTFCGADALQLRRLRLALREHAATEEEGTLTHVAVHPRDLLTMEEPWVRPLQRWHAIRAAVQKAQQQEGASIHSVLWAAWEASQCASRWKTRALAGGRSGASADADLDAMLSLMAEAQRLDTGALNMDTAAFCEQILARRLPTTVRAPQANISDAVSVLTAHATKGREWEIVCIAGVTEGHWPALAGRSTVLGVEDVVEIAAGEYTPGLSRVRERLRDERRLFSLSCTRARTRVVVTATDGIDALGTQLPSRFLDEMDPIPEGQQREHTLLPSPTTLSGLVSRLRDIVEDSDHPHTQSAAQQLAYLSRHDVPGAHPDTWWGIGGVTSRSPLVPPGKMLHLTPSNVEKVLACPLRWMLEKHGGAVRAQDYQQLGTVVHEIAAWAASVSVERHGAVPSVAELESELKKHLTPHGITNDPDYPWVARRTFERAQRMVGMLSQWLSAAQRRYVASEEAFSVALTEDVTLHGRADRIEQDEDGRVVVVDFKTSASPPSSKEAQNSRQLGVYQAAVAAGAFACGDTPGGAELVQLGTKNKNVATQRQSAPQDSPDPLWSQKTIRQAADAMRGPEFAAVRNAHCPSCPVRSSCPVHADFVV